MYELEPSASQYLIQVINRKTGVVVAWAPGLRVEKQFESELLDRVRAKGVGVGRTEAHVLVDVRDALRELLYDLKSQV